MSKNQMKAYDVWCVITKEVDCGLVDFNIIVDSTNIVDAAHKVECLLEKSGIEYCMQQIQEVER